jgi:hypothetical protein
MTTDRNLIVLVKGTERYAVVYDAGSQEEAIRVLARWASHNELGFTWYDAAVLSQRIRQNQQPTQRL